MLSIRLRGDLKGKEKDFVISPVVRFVLPVVSIYQKKRSFPSSESSYRAGEEREIMDTGIHASVNYHALAHHTRIQVGASKSSVALWR